MLEIERAIDHINRLLLTHEMVLEENKLNTRIDCKEKSKAILTIKAALEKQLNVGWIPVDENPPLTIEELKQMNYQPIWIQNINSEIGLDGWGIFRAAQVKQIANCQCEANISYYMKDYGRKWLAYRRKPN